MMPGGSPAAWPLVKPIFQSIAAKVGPNNDIPCCDWVGPDGAGQYVKMVHNGIEYGDMQMICEAYLLMKTTLGLTNSEMYDVFSEWNKGELDSYLIEITRDIFSVKDPETGKDMVDLIMDKAGREGNRQVDEPTGARPRRAQHAGHRSRVRSLLVSAQGCPRSCEQGSQRPDGKVHRDKKQFIEAVRQALYASKICSYAQGYVQLQAAAKENNWPSTSAASPVVARRLHHPRSLLGAHQGGLRRRQESREPAARAVFPRTSSRRRRPRGGT